MRIVQVRLHRLAHHADYLLEGNQELGQLGEAVITAPCSTVRITMQPTEIGFPILPTYLGQNR